jgi:nucleotide-binding universal stress UspA family protein
MKMIWAIDPFSSETSVQEITCRVIKAWTAKAPAQVEPVHISSDPYANVPSDLISHYENDLKREAESIVSQWRSRMEMENISPVRVIGSKKVRSIQDRVHYLLEYAKASGADLIVTSTRAKKGLSHWFIGSFAETLALTAEIPILFVNPSLELNKVENAFRQILFPTDFSEESFQAFKQLLPVAKTFGSKVEIFHQYQYGLSPELNFATLMATYASQDQIKQELENVKSRGNIWKDLAVQKGINAELKVVDTPNEAITRSILEENKNAAGLIAMAAISNSIEANLLGSIVRQVIRTSTSPVWVLRANASIE